MPVTINTSDESDRWRYRCPKGHTRWEPTNYHFWCEQCAKSLDPDVEPEFQELVDKKTGKTYEREDIRIEGYRKATA